MKKCKFDDYRSFTHCSEAYYTKPIGLSPGVVDEIFFGLSCGGGGTHGEMKMEFRELGRKIVPQLQVFDDGWEVLASFTDLLTEMAKVSCPCSVNSITPKQFCEMLVRCGFKDITLRENPNPVPEESKIPPLEGYKQALHTIATLWPIETSAKIGNVAGINDGRSRAIIAENAVVIARRALGIERMP
jgi:hypothetical protein